MPDKKLTDNEIIKVLECCSKPVSENCKECPLCSVDCMSISIEKLSLDLINRLQEENKKWQGGYMTQKQEIANLEIELKTMRGAANSYKEETEGLKTKIKSVYKELERISLMTVETNRKELVGEKNVD